MKHNPVDPDTYYMTVGACPTLHGRYEYVIGGYETEPTQRSLTGEAFPVTVLRAGMFKTRASAKSAGVRAFQALQVAS
jgi:hypothetical protein